MYHFQKWLGFAIFCDFDTCHKEITIQSLFGSPCIQHVIEKSKFFPSISPSAERLLSSMRNPDFPLVLLLVVPRCAASFTGLAAS